MFRSFNFSVYDFVLGISEAVDLISPSLNSHHKRVAYMACAIAEEMGLSDKMVKNVAVAGILHDIGAFSLRERIDILNNSFESEDPDAHAFTGYMLLKPFEPLKDAAEIIRYHHADYDASQTHIPVGSHILRLADVAAILMDDSRDILEQRKEIGAAVLSGPYLPAAIDALLRLSPREYFWIEARTVGLSGVMAPQLNMSHMMMDLEDLLVFSRVIAQIIDFRSRFTSTHSSGVAAVALALSEILEFSEKECRLMEVAGYVHDVGKLTVSNEILEKPGPLGYDEVNVMRRHTYYTHMVLSRIRGLEDVTMWASFHHERVDGNGYPFHVKGRDFTRLSRIMAVADIFTAITEDRPYRQGMDAERAKGVLNRMAEGNAVDKGIVAVVNEKFHDINAKRERAQAEALRAYETFLKNVAEASALRK